MSNENPSSFLNDPTARIAQRGEEKQTTEEPIAPQEPPKAEQPRAQEQPVDPSQLNPAQSSSFPNLDPLQGNPELEKKLTDVKDLASLGRIIATVERFGLRFKFHTLSAKESADAVKSFALMSETSQAIDMGIATISRALDSINDVPLENLYEIYVPQSERLRDATVMDKRIQIIGFLDPNVVGELLGEYQKLIARSQEAIGIIPALKK